MVSQPPKPKPTVESLLKEALHELFDGASFSDSYIEKVVAVTRADLALIEGVRKIEDELQGISSDIQRMMDEPLHSTD